MGFFWLPVSVSMRLLLGPLLLVELFAMRPPYQQPKSVIPPGEEGGYWTGLAGHNHSKMANPHDPLCMYTNPCLNRPKITLRGKATVYVPMLAQVEQDEDLDKHYEDKGAKCADPKDGDISGSVITTGDVIDLARPGTYMIHYECNNVLGIAAYVVSRTIVVLPKGAQIPKDPHEGTNLRSMLHYYQGRPDTPTQTHVAGSQIRDAQSKIQHHHQALLTAQSGHSWNSAVAAAQAPEVDGEYAAVPMHEPEENTAKGTVKATQKSSHGTCSFENNFARRGHDLHPSLDADSREECCQHCLKVLPCVAWTFDKSTGICWLQDMDDPEMKQDSPLCDSGVVQTDHFDVTASVQIQGETVKTFTEAKKELFKESVAGEFHLLPKQVVVLGVTTGGALPMRRRLAGAAAAATAVASVHVQFQLVDLTPQMSNTIVTHLYEPVFAKELEQELQSHAYPVKALRLENDTIRQRKHISWAQRRIYIAIAAVCMLMMAGVVFSVSSSSGPSSSGDSSDSTYGDDEKFSAEVEGIVIAGKKKTKRNIDEYGSLG